MDIEKATAMRDEERERRAEIAGAKVFEMGLPKEIQTSENISGLGTKTATVYAKTRDELLKVYGSKYSKIIALALHEYWFACWDGAAFFQLSIEDESFNDNEYTRALATASGYADMHGWANTLADGFADISPSSGRKEWIRRLTGQDILDISIALRCMAIYWLDQASMEIKSGNTESACDLIHEANDALSINFSNAVWKDAWDDATKNAEDVVRINDGKLDSADAKQEAARIISERNRKAALASHWDTHKLKAEVFEWHKENRKKFKSRAEATRAFLESKLVPLTYTTIYDYFSEWDKFNYAK